MIEPLGPHTLLLAEIGGAKVTPQVDAHFPVAPGQTCRITLDMTQMHLFDSETQRRSEGWRPTPNAGWDASIWT